jgi:L-alanine-DL-glutamate epimerase-like enolase superfamily enzyme
MVEARLRAPLVSSTGATSSRPLILASLTGEDGVAGHGEAAPLSGYHGASIDEVHAGLEACRPALDRSDGQDRVRLLAECAERTVLPQALAAIDLALWDLAGRRAGRPLWDLLGADDAGEVELNATIGAEDRAGAAREAAAARAKGFRALKVKVGVGDDAGRLAAVRAAAGREMTIRIDANGAWSAQEAVAALRALEPVGIECCEEPVHGIGAIQRVAGATAIPIALDETAPDGDALDHKICDVVCLKIARAGITGLLRGASRARAAGYELYISSSLDGPLGIAAALHAAAVVAPERPCGLATLSMFDAREDPMPPYEGRLRPPTGPGLGDGLLAWYDV